MIIEWEFELLFQPLYQVSLSPLKIVEIDTEFHSETEIGIEKLAESIPPLPAALIRLAISEKLLPEYDNNYEVIFPDEGKLTYSC